MTEQEQTGAATFILLAASQQMETGSFKQLSADVRHILATRNAIIAAAKDLLDTIPVPPTENGRRVFENLRQAIWESAP